MGVKPALPPCGVSALRTAAPPLFLVLLLAALPLWGPAGAGAEAASLEEARKLHHQAADLYQAGRYQEALPLQQRARGLYEQALGPEHPETLISLNNLAEMYRALGDYREALPLYQRVLAAREKSPGPDHPDTATSLSNLAGLYRARGDYAQALPLYQRALAIRERALGPEHPLTSSSLNNLGALYQAMGKYDEAMPLYRRAFQIRERILGPDHPDTAVSLNNLAGVYESLGRFEEALPLYRRALENLEKSRGPEHPTTVVTLNNLALLLQTMGKYQEALPLLRRAVQSTEKTYGPRHPDTATSLNNLAELLAALDRHQEALSLHRQALAIREQALGPDHPDTTASLNNLAGVLQALGFYEQALPFYRQALESREKTLGPEHPGTSLSLNNLANLYRDLGRYEDAVPLARRALMIREQVLGPHHPDTATTFNNLGELYEAMGAYDQALPRYQQALQVYEQALGPEHPRTAGVLSNLALLYKTLGNYDQALPLFRRSLTIREKVLGPDHLDTALSLNNLAMLHKAMGDYPQALALLQRTLTILEKTLGPDHPYAATVAGNLGFLHLDRKDYQAAEACFRRSQAVYGLAEIALARGQPQEALGLLPAAPPGPLDLPTRRITYHTLKGLAQGRAGRRGEAALELRLALEEVEDLRRRAPGERAGFFQAGIYGGFVRPYRELAAVLAEMALKSEALPIGLRDYGPDPAAAAFYVAENTKARALLEALARTARRRTTTEIPEDLRRREESLARELAALEVRWEKAWKGGREALLEVQAQKARLSAELKTLIQELRQRHPLYAALHYPQPLPAAEVPLREDEVLLEYALGETAGFVVMVKKGGRTKVVKIPLGREELEARVQAFMEPLINRDPDGFSLSRARELGELLLGGVLPQVQEQDRLIIVPDGILGLVPFEALVLKAGAGPGERVFVGDRYRLSYYQSAAILALKRRLATPRAARPLFALGHPVFSPEDARLTPAPRDKKPSDAAAFRALAAQEAWGKTTRDRSAAQELTYIPLPETEQEVLAIARLLGVEPRAPDVLLNLNANETTLRQSPLQEYRYLHFATHADLPGMAQGPGEPFLLLGQVGNQGEDNGFLTLSKVLGLNLRADMVVLSACLTGRGRVMEGEGVANFARAFQHAGAHSVVVSLWEVASVEAVEFMTLFYSHLKEGRTRSEALTLARRAIKARYPSPFFWAVFILHGEG
jgi:tetratricopeptide (TPR) repeat protein